MGMITQDKMAEALAWLDNSKVLTIKPLEQRARWILLDTYGCVLAGLRAEALISLGAVLRQSDPGPVRLGSVEGLSIHSAAQLFAAASCWDEACEGHAAAHGRPGLAVLAALYPLCRDQSLGHLIEALIHGYEMGVRFGHALRIRPGMHVDGQWPALAAAVAVSKAMGLTQEQTIQVIDTVACQMPLSLYLPVKAGATSRNTYLGHAASLAIGSAWAVKAGVSAPQGAVMGYAAIGLGHEQVNWIEPRTFEILNGYLKPYAAVRHVHYGAKAAQILRQSLDPRRIEAIKLSVYEEATIYCGNRNPLTPIQAQFSLSFGIAAALAFDRLDAEVYRTGLFDDALLRHLEALVEISIDPVRTSENRRGATLSLLVDGHWHHESVDAVWGDRDCPLDEAGVREKFIAYASPSLGIEQSQKLADAILEGSLDQGLDTIWSL